MTETNDQHLENIFSFLEIFFDDVDIVFEIDPQGGKMFLISNNSHEEAAKKSLRDGVQKLLNKRPQSEAMNPVRLTVPIGGKRETLFVIPFKKKEEKLSKYLGVIVGGCEKENLEGFLSRNIRKKLESEGSIKPGPGVGMSRKLQEFKQYAQKLEKLNTRRKEANIKLHEELNHIKSDKKFTEENYKKLLGLVNELEGERDEYRMVSEQAIEENKELIGQLDEIGSVLAKVTEFENEREGYLRLLHEKDLTIQESKTENEIKEGFLDIFKHLILEIEGDGQISYCNKNMENFYEGAFGETGAAKNDFQSVLKSDDLPNIEAAVNDAIKSGKETTIDINLHKANPKTRNTEKLPFKLYAFPLKGGPDCENSAGLLMWQT